MLLLTESNALTLWNDCTYNAGTMQRLNVGTRRAALLEQVGQTKRATGVSKTNKVCHWCKSDKQSVLHYWMLLSPSTNAARRVPTFADSQYLWVLIRNWRQA